MATNGTGHLHSIEGIVVEINAIKATVSQLASTVNTLAETINERGRAPWGVILTGIGVSVTIIIAVGGLAYWPVISGQQKAEVRIEQLQARVDTVAGGYVSRAENDRLRSEDKDRAAIVRQQVNDDIKQLTEAVNTISRTFVPRVEAEAIARLQEKLADERAKNTELRLDRHSQAIQKLSGK